MEEDRYKNPRNLCSGSVRQLNNEITAKRNVQFWAFALVKAEDVNFDNSREKQFLFLKEQGFDVVEYRRTDGSKMLEDIAYFEKKIEHYDIPSDGLVLVYDDVAYGTALGTTAKFPRDAIAFKWADEQKETILTEIEWSPSRTGLINPVAIFEPVELEGTTVSRASVHNISIMQNMKLGIGDKIMVYKANMIIPQIAENLTESNHIEIPKACPVCGMPTEIKMINDVKWLYCVNDECAAKKIKAFTLFVSRDAMNIDGLSEATLEKFINRGYIHEFADLFHLDKYQNEIEQMEGFGAKSFRNLADSIEKARHTTLPKVIYGLGIANIGLATAKILCRHFNYDMEQMKQADVTEISEIEGIGEVIATAFYQYLSKEEHKQSMERLWKELDIEIPVLDESSMTLAGKTFVITGSLNRFANRNELKELIESRGGKVTGSVTGKTDCLINNDNMSGSSKNKKAKELQVPVLTEEEFMVLYIR